MVSLAKQLAQRGWRISFLVAVKPSNQNKVDELRRAGIAVNSLNMRKNGIPILGFLRLVKLLRTLKPEILHCHSVHANLFGRLARVFAPVPVVISTAHNIHEGSRWREICYRFTDRLADITTQVSEAGANRYVAIRAVPEGKMIVIPNGVDVTRFSKTEKSDNYVKKELSLEAAFIWLAIGRFTNQKNFPLLLRAFEKVVRRRPDSLLVLLGDGPSRNEIEQLVGDLDLDEHVRVLGFREDINRLLNAADAFVLSSSWEGMPMVLLEAAACELPIVATEVGGVPEILEHGSGGFLVRSGDETALVKKMLHVMALPPSSRVTLGRVARERILAQYDIGKVIGHWESLYHELLGR